MGNEFGYIMSDLEVREVEVLAHNVLAVNYYKDLVFRELTPRHLVLNLFFDPAGIVVSALTLVLQGRALRFLGRVEWLIELSVFVFLFVGLKLL